MTLEEIERTLPNGFHDSEITSITLDYENRIARFDLNILFSVPDKPGRESYKPATLSFLQFIYCIIEAPDATYPFQIKKPLMVDGGSDMPATKLPEPLPEGAFTYAFFVNDWNSFIYLAAFDAQILLH